MYKQFSIHVPIIFLCINHFPIVFHPTSVALPGAETPCPRASTARRRGPWPPLSARRRWPGRGGRRWGASGGPGDWWCPPPKKKNMGKWRENHKKTTGKPLKSYIPIGENHRFINGKTREKLSDNYRKMEGLPSGKRLHNCGKSQCLLGKSTILAILANC